MPARQLVTIGDMFQASPLRRQASRRQRMQGLGSATADTGGAALQDAAITLLNHLDEAVPPESQQDALVGAFQVAWNQDPANSGDQLVPDSKYGPLTKGALDAMTGGIAPAVNGGGAPAPAPAPSPAPGPAPAPSPHAPIAPASESHMTMLLLLAAAAIAAYLLFFRSKKGRRSSSRRSSPLVEVRSNPRRGRRRNAELI